MPVVSAKFSLSVPGQELAQFTELAGLGQPGSVDFMRSGDADLILRLPANGTLTFRRPRSSDTRISVWHKSRARRSCSLVMYNASGSPVARYNLTNAWPSKIEIGNERGGGSQALMETVTIVCERIQRVSV
jgi:phage tail-like protein